MALTRRKTATVLLFSLSACSVGLADTDWQADPSMPEDWFDPAAWSAGVPSSTQNAYILNGGTATITYGNAIMENLYLGYNNNTSGNLSMSAGQMTCNYLYIGLGGGTGIVNQSGGGKTQRVTFT